VAETVAARDAGVTVIKVTYKSVLQSVNPNHSWDVDNIETLTNFGFNIRPLNEGDNGFLGFYGQTHKIEDLVKTYYTRIGFMYNFIKLAMKGEQLRMEIDEDRNTIVTIVNERE